MTNSDLRFCVAFLSSFSASCLFCLWVTVANLGNAKDEIRRIVADNIELRKEAKDE